MSLYSILVLFIKYHIYITGDCRICFLNLLKFGSIFFDFGFQLDLFSVRLRFRVGENFFVGSGSGLHQIQFSGSDRVLKTLTQILKFKVPQIVDFKQHNV